MTETTEPRAVVTWAGPGEPIVLTLYGLHGEVTVPLLPKRALTLAQELLTCGVQAIKADTWDAMYGQGTPQRAPDLGAAGGEQAITSLKGQFEGQLGPNFALIPA